MKKAIRRPVVTQEVLAQLKLPKNSRRAQRLMKERLTRRKPSRRQPLAAAQKRRDIATVGKTTTKNS
jgi:hypothetical protein